MGEAQNSTSSFRKILRIAARDMQENPDNLVINSFDKKSNHLTTPGDGFYQQVQYVTGIGASIIQNYDNAQTLPTDGVLQKQQIFVDWRANFRHSLTFTQADNQELSLLIRADTPSYDIGGSGIPNAIMQGNLTSADIAGRKYLTQALVWTSKSVFVDVVGAADDEMTLQVFLSRMRVFLGAFNRGVMMQLHPSFLGLFEREQDVRKTGVSYAEIGLDAAIEVVRQQQGYSLTYNLVQRLPTLRNATFVNAAAGVTPTIALNHSIQRVSASNPTQIRINAGSANALTITPLTKIRFKRTDGTFGVLSITDPRLFTDSKEATSVSISAGANANFAINNYLNSKDLPLTTAEPDITFLGLSNQVYVMCYAFIPGAIELYEREFVTLLNQQVPIVSNLFGDSTAGGLFRNFRVTVTNTVFLGGGSGNPNRLVFDHQGAIFARFPDRMVAIPLLQSLIPDDYATHPTTRSD